MKDKKLVSFYKSAAWKNCRDSFFKTRGGLCERCLKKNIIRAGKIVHHRIYLNSKNVDDPKISLNFDNLELLCQDCHNKEHHASRSDKRYYFDKQGNMIYTNMESESIE